MAEAVLALPSRRISEKSATDRPWEASSVLGADDAHHHNPLASLAKPQIRTLIVGIVIAIVFDVAIRAIPMDVNATASALGRPIVRHTIDDRHIFVSRGYRPTLFFFRVVPRAAFAHLKPQLRLGFMEELAIAIEKRAINGGSSRIDF